MNILFICLGNICRSPIAEVIFRQHVERAGRSAEFPLIDSAPWMPTTSADCAHFVPTKR